MDISQTQPVMSSDAPEAPPPDALVQVRDLVKAYKGRPVVNGVAMHIHQGEVVGLLGPNGAGKTTTFYMIVGLVKPDAGEIVFDGEEIARLPMYQRARRGIGYLAQEPSIFPRMSVEDNVMAILETLDISREERDQRLDHLLAGLSLSHLAKQKAITLSGGEKRRLEITRVLVTNPSFIMLDEPFANIDPIAVHEVQKIVAQLKGMGLGILVTDHSVRETLDIVDRAYLICEGQILCQGDREFLTKDERAREVYLGPMFAD